MREKTDSELGLKVRGHLCTLGLETLVSEPDPENASVYLKGGISSFLRYIGLNDEDPSLIDTPQRVADMFVEELCRGLIYENFPKCTTTPNGEYAEKFGRVPAGSDPETNRGRIDEMIVKKGITTISLCEHHFQVIHGVTHIAYIPGPKILGVSKLIRVTDFYARRPQMQERMTAQIYAALAFILETEDVAVYQECYHNCVRARGAMDPHSEMITSKMGGKFMHNPSLRQEFLHAIR